MKKLLTGLMLLWGTAPIWAQSASITQAKGWLESAFVEWQPVSGAQSYNVYYTGEGYTNQKIDDQLIRNYGSHFRADIPGLKAGNYTLKVVPVVSGSEKTAASTPSLSVLPHDRSGFAFANGRVPGAYKADGTPKSGAIILYITENTKNTVSLEVTGASTNPCVGVQAILDGYKKGKDTRPLILRLVGQVTDPSYTLGGDLVIENAKNASSYITFEGIGKDAVADGWGIRIKNASNIEVRNLATMNVNSSEGDNIGLQQNNDYVWVHNNDFFYGDAGSDGDQAKGDGALDCKKSTYVTFSYNHFWDTGKSNLLGLSEGTTSGLYITYHHNWYDHSDSRHPRVRYYSAHVYNNYYDGIAKYGIGSTLGSSVFAEGNYFRNCKYPILTSMQGSDVYDESAGKNDYGEMPTFSREDGGTIKAFNNYMEGQKRFVPYGNTQHPNPTVDFDAYVVTTRNATVPSSVKSAYGANTYNNFDTDASVMYAYTADSPENAKTKVTTYAGRVQGGDFVWTFNNDVDDASYAVNAALKSALSSYTTQLVSIQGDGNGNGGTVPVEPSSSSVTPSSSSVTPSSSSVNPSSSSVTPSSSSVTPSSSSVNPSSSSVGIIESDKIHNFTLSGTHSTFFTISGNLSTSKGTVEYQGLTLTQCLKMETATQITFDLEAPATLTLVFNVDFNGSVKINAESYPVSNGIASIDLKAGPYSITKGDASNLYYMAIDLEQSVEPPPPLASLQGNQEPHPIHFNAFTQQLHIAQTHLVQKVQVFGLNGAQEHFVQASGNTLSLATLQRGAHMVVVRTNKGIFHKTVMIH